MSLIETDVNLCQEFVRLMPPHIFQLLRYCKIKATADEGDREIVILVPNVDFGKTLAAQPELRQAADYLGVNSLRVTNRPI